MTPLKQRVAVPHAIESHPGKPMPCFWERTLDRRGDTSDIRLAPHSYYGNHSLAVIQQGDERESERQKAVQAKSRPDSEKGPAQGPRG
jgi:hypothetical protein